jgi:HAD superfamily hydrolase (TIGR01490 family)
MAFTHRRRAAAFFDLDRTIIATSSATAFTGPLFKGGLITRREVLRASYAQFLFLTAGADHQQSERVRIFLSSLIAGWDVAQVDQIVAETLHDLISPHVYAEAVELIRDHHEADRDVVVVSASGQALVEPIAEMLGADHVIATKLAVDDGKYTGEIEFYAYAQNKARAIAELAEQEGYDLADCWAYSDSVTDVPMLEAVGHPVAVNPDKGLRRHALAQGWPIRDFHHPVPLRTRVDTPASRAALGTLLLTVLALVLWAVLRRRAHRMVERA